ncbi:uncharacterized protein LOC127278595 isoform X1 [Leptopilina boulardi]|uniref:uncharacterized protein LOC127278595 isoform X1 n=1 Tax=Leptopilina boulardi TaxID=63433 RepID=UPI0021F69A17|nr:uncharacterized protein LOC127278595 isoform X1 [Leptopilina boulardi]
MDKRMFGLQPIEFRRIAYQFAEANNIPHRFNKDVGAAGKDWFKDFRNRHPELSLRTPEKTSFARACGFNKPNVEQFFHLLLQLMTKYSLSPSRIYNVVETGISSVPNVVPKILSVKGKKQVGLLTSAERGETITCVICCNAAGNFIPPTLMFPRKRMKSELKNGCPPESLIVFHPSGWMQTEIFCPVWFDHFLKYAKPSENNPVLLILDGHSTHVKNLNLIYSAQKNNVAV